MSHIQQLISKAIDDVHNGVVITNPQQKDNPIIYVNKGFERITGYTKEEVIGKNCRFMQGPSTNPQDIETIRGALRKKQALRIVIKNHKKNTEEFDNELYITPIYNPQGKVTHFIGIQNDISKQRRAEKELDKYKQYLEELIEQRTKQIQEKNKQLNKEIEHRKKTQEELTLIYEELDKNNKELENKLQRAQKNKIKLTHKQKQVFYELCAQPQKNIKEISQKTGIASSSLSTIRNKLKEQGYIKKKYLPTPYLQGLKHMTIINYHSNTKEKTQQKEQETNKNITKNPYVVFAAGNQQAGIIILLNKNWEEAHKQANTITQENNIDPQHYKTIRTHHIELDTAQINAYFDYTEYLRRRLNIQQAPTHTTNKQNDGKTQETQKKIIYGLCKYPQASIKELSTKINVSEPAIIKHKQELIKEEKILARNIPTLQQTKGNILVYQYHQFTKNNHANKRTQEIIDIHTDTEQHSISVYEDYQELRSEQDKCTACTSKELITEHSIKLPITSITYQKLDFSEAVKHALIIQQEQKFIKRVSITN